MNGLMDVGPEEVGDSNLELPLWKGQGAAYKGVMYVREKMRKLRGNEFRFQIWN
jgi:hypothetical protein